MNKNYTKTTQERQDLIDDIANKVNICNNKINKENELLINIKNKNHVLSLLDEQHEKLQIASTKCISVISAYSEFQENNNEYIQFIKKHFNNKWTESESKWWEWNIIDIISWFKYKTIGMDTNNLNWKSIETEMRKRNINGKSLQHFNDSRLDMIGIHDFNISVILMKEIVTLRTKYNYIYNNDDTKDNDNDDDDDVEDKIPSKFICPLTKQIMRDPVIAFDGNVYEREAIKKHLKEKKVSPITGEKAFTIILFPNQQLKKEIQAYNLINDLSTAAEGECESNVVYID